MFRFVFNFCCLLALAGCNEENNSSLSDIDGDGFTIGAGDCQDNNAEIFPDAVDVANNGIDEDCSGGDLIDLSLLDLDEDSFIPSEGDCNDNNAEIFPGAIEVVNNGVDEDCNGVDHIDLSLLDLDDDSFTPSEGDCNDNNAEIFPGAIDVANNGIDEDCEGGDHTNASLLDIDGDGYSPASGDCNDGNAGIFPGALDVANNSLDEDCNGEDLLDISLLDLDDDSFTPSEGDCDDSNTDIYPGAVDVVNNGIDEDCNGEDSIDASKLDIDNDGYTPASGDCDDSNAEIFPGAEDLPKNGIDEDCSGNDLIELLVPKYFPSIQDAVNHATEGEIIIIEKGTYVESVIISNKKDIHIQGNSINNTIIDGSESFAFSIYDSENILITDLSITNSDDGITANASISIERVKVYDTIDGIDMEGGYLIVRGSRFFDNKDDAIDLDEYTSAIIEQNIITRSGDDGIEIRLHPQPDSEEPITITINNNVITDSMSDGIQLIDYEDVTKREFIIQRNLFLNIQNAGVSFKDNAETLPTLIPGELGEKVNISNNTFAYGKVGVLANGQKLAAFNNVFINHSEGAYISDTVSSFGYSAIHTEQNSESGNFINSGKLFLNECYQPLGFAVLVINQGANSFELNGEMFRANDSLVEDEKHDIGFWEFNANTPMSCELINN